MRRKFPLDEQALSRFADVLAQEETFGSGQPGCVKVVWQAWWKQR